LDGKITAILEKAEKTHSLLKDEIIFLLSLNEENAASLFIAADKVRQEYVGDEIHLRGLIEFSNYCIKDCAYCGIRKSGEGIKRYRISEDDIIKIAGKAYEIGYKTLVLQCGEDPYYDVKKLCYTTESIKEKYAMALTLSAGEMELSDFDILKSCGVDRYLLRIETTNRELFEKYHPDKDFDNRIKILRHFKKIGIQAGTGVLIGLPGQKAEDLAGDLLFYKEMNIDMVGMGPFIPCPGTPMENYEPGSVFLTLKMIALTRLLNPDIHIPATTALETLGSGAREQALNCGADVIMPNVTPYEFKEKYKLYPDKAGLNLDEDEARSYIESIVIKLGRKVGLGFGHREKH
jgi:biotin synthase